MNFSKKITKNLLAKSRMLGNFYFGDIENYRLYMTRNKLWPEKVKTPEETIRFCAKGKTKDNPGNGQWGYYPFHGIRDVYEVMEILKLKSIIDLGAGVGHLIAALRKGAFYTIRGLEIEPELIKEHHELVGMNYVYNHSILELDKPLEIYKGHEVKSPLLWGSDHPFHAVYFYEPFKEEKMARKFAIHVADNLFKDQYIIYKPAGPYMNEEFKRRKDLRFVGNHHGLFIYRKK